MFDLYHPQEMFVLHKKCSLNTTKLRKKSVSLTCASMRDRATPFPDEKPTIRLGREHE